jgi:hypothetical protein
VTLTEKDLESFCSYVYVSCRGFNQNFVCHGSKFILSVFLLSFVCFLTYFFIL